MEQPPFDLATGEALRRPFRGQAAGYSLAIFPRGRPHAS